VVAAGRIDVDDRDARFMDVDGLRMPSEEQRSSTPGMLPKSILEQIIEDMQDQLRGRDAVPPELVERLGAREGEGLLGSADALMEAIRAAIREDES
jgi:hypothetical protein